MFPSRFLFLFFFSFKIPLFLINSLLHRSVSASIFLLLSSSPTFVFLQPLVTGSGAHDGYYLSSDPFSFVGRTCHIENEMRSVAGNLFLLLFFFSTLLDKNSTARLFWVWMRMKTTTKKEKIAMKTDKKRSNLSKVLTHRPRSHGRLAFISSSYSLLYAVHSGLPLTLSFRGSRSTCART